MNLDYRCTHCQNQINDQEFLIFDISKRNQKNSEIFISVIPENYKYLVKGDYKPKKGDLVEFKCQSCGAINNLESDPSKVQIELWISDLIKFKIQFSALCGVQETKILIDGELEDYKLSKVNFLRRWVNKTA